MRLNEQEIKMFDGLRNTALGADIVKYIERLEGDICDVRNWTEKDTPESARQASKALKEMRGHLQVSFGKQSVPNEYI
jgi:hypothetical protein